MIHHIAGVTDSDITFAIATIGYIYLLICIIYVSVLMYARLMPWIGEQYRLWIYERNFRKFVKVVTNVAKQSRRI